LGFRVQGLGFGLRILFMSMLFRRRGFYLFCTNGGKKRTSPPRGLNPESSKRLLMISTYACAMVTSDLARASSCADAYRRETLRLYRHLVRRICTQTHRKYTRPNHALITAKLESSGPKSKHIRITRPTSLSGNALNPSARLSGI